MQKIMYISRYTEILRYFWKELIGFGSWGIPWLAFGIIPILLVYYTLSHSHVIKEHRPAYVAGITMLVVQVLGYYAVYLITPYDLTWHLSYSIQRIALQIFPLLAFMILAASRAPESIFEAN